MRRGRIQCRSFGYTSAQRRSDDTEAASTRLGASVDVTDAPSIEYPGVTAFDHFLTGVTRRYVNLRS